MARQLPYKFTSKKGNDVCFRYPKASDLNDCLRFANEIIAEDTFVELSGEPKTLQEEKAWLDERLEQGRQKKKIHVVVTVNGEYAGNAEVRRGQYRHSHTGEVGILLAKKWREEGIGTELLKALIDESTAHGIRLLTLGCYAGNDRACHVYEKLGFAKMGVTPNAVRWKNGYIDEIEFYLPL